MLRSLVGSEMCIRDRFRTSNWIFRDLRIRRPLLPRNHVPNCMRHQQQVPPCILAPLTLRPSRSSAAAGEFGVRFRSIFRPRIELSENLEFDVRFRPGTTCRITCATSSRSPLAFLLLLLSAQIGHLPPPTEFGVRFRANSGPRIGFSENVEFDVRVRPGTTCRISCATSS